MNMNDTQVKTRHGLILQGITGAALEAAGIAYEPDVQYDPTCEKPDFLIPNSSKPKFMVEVHQTDVRNSLAMKTLRAFIAVSEAKAVFGPDLVSVNLVFGDPDEDFSSSPLSAISAIYDLSIFPAREKSSKRALQKLEAESMSLAEDEAYTTRQAIADICARETASISTFGATLKALIDGARARPELKSLWKFEQDRQRALGKFPKAGFPTYYKRMMLGALFFSDSDFENLLEGIDTGAFPGEVSKQLVRVGLGKITEEIDGDHLEVCAEFSSFLRDPLASHLRNQCKYVLDSVPEMHWFFEDIRSSDRRLTMAKIFIKAVCAGKEVFARELQTSLGCTAYKGMDHLRGWLVDISAVATGKSFNHFNKAIFQDTRYPLTLWNAFSNLAIRSPSLVNNSDRLRILCEIVSDKIFESLKDSGVTGKNLDQMSLADGLLIFRVNSAIKLRKLNPLVVIVANVAADYGLTIQRPTLDTLLFDLSESAGVGRFLVFSLKDPRTEKEILLSVVAVHEGNGDHKSKEWGARRIASLYRFTDGKVVKSGLDDGLFVIDGEWDDKDVARLYRSGWNHICRLGELEETLKRIFSLKEKVKSVKAKKAALAILDVGDD
jgi:hypothetical protein